MRILMVTPGYPPVRGGTEVVVRNLSIELNNAGIHTDVLTFNMDQKWDSKWRRKTETLDGITVFRIPGLNWLPVAHSSRITFGINLIPGKFTNIMSDYDIIHFHEMDLSFPLFSFSVRRPKIFHLHGIDPNFYRKINLGRYAFRRVAELYISLSKEMERDLMRLGIPQGKITRLPNAVNTQLFCPKNGREDRLLLFVGRITHGKGLHVLLESLNQVENSVRLVIIGPKDWDVRYFQNFLSTVASVNKKGKHRIDYLGPLDQASIVEWYQKASIFVLPSFAEAFPVVALEALSCETPVIASSVGGVQEIVQNNENGVLIPANNPVQLGEQIQYLLDNAEVRIRFGKAGRKLVEENFSLKVIVRRLRDIYSKIASSARYRKSTNTSI